VSRASSTAYVPGPPSFPSTPRLLPAHSAISSSHHPPSLGRLTPSALPPFAFPSQNTHSAHTTTTGAGYDQHSTGLAGQQHGLASGGTAYGHQQQQPIGGAYGAGAHGGAPLSGSAHGAHSSTTGGGIGEKLGNALPGGGHTSTSTTTTTTGSGLGGRGAHGTTGTNAYGDNRTAGEKIKDALPGGNSSHGNATHSTTTGAGAGYGSSHDATLGHGSHTGTHTTGAGGVGHSAHGNTYGGDNRTLTEKAKDAMPGNNTTGTHGTTGTTHGTGLGHDTSHQCVVLLCSSPLQRPG
jgi:hypothetical protein